MFTLPEHNYYTYLFLFIVSYSCNVYMKPWINNMNYCYRLCNSLSCEQSDVAKVILNNFQYKTTLKKIKYKMVNECKRITGTRTTETYSSKLPLKRDLL
jgi:hypothetical protein